MELYNRSAELYFPANGKKGGLRAVTDLCVAAHQDDAEIMAYHAIAECFGDESRSFCAVIASDGAGSPRKGKFADMTDEQMKTVRAAEQKKAAEVGRYGALALLGYPSAALKDGGNGHPARDIAQILLEARPARVYIHNFADKHDTHVASALRTLAALRSVRDEYVPEKLYLLEVWRGLDWLCDGDKTLFDASAEPRLAKDILDVYESQIAGGKRYDLAAIGRRYANATFFESHDTDELSAASYALDATRLVTSDESPFSFIADYIAHFENEVSDRLKRLG